MKKCQKCSKENEDNATYCTNCGNYLGSVNKNSNNKMVLIFLILFLVFTSAFGIDFLRSNRQDTIQKVSSSLEPVKDSKINEVIVKQITKLDDLKKEYDNVDIYVNGLKNFESDLDKIINQKIVKTYYITISNLNNIYFEGRYNFKYQNFDYEVGIFYDRTKKYNNLEISSLEYNIDKLEDYSHSKSLELFKLIYDKLSVKSTGIYQDTLAYFNDLANQKIETYGNYGLNKKLKKDNDILNINIRQDKKYRIKYKFEGKFKLDKVGL